MKITVWLIPTRQRFDNCLLKKFNYKRCLFFNTYFEISSISLAFINNNHLKKNY
jgi:hypothetical protein